LGVKATRADVQMRQRRARDDTQPPTMVSRGYGIVEFATVGDRAKALEAAQGKELAERKLRVKPYFEKPATTATTATATTAN
jgi:RNA recognition motif-containing protein